MNTVEEPPGGGCGMEEGGVDLPETTTDGSREINLAATRRSRGSRRKYDWFK